jgi:hypothetical protein
MHRIDIALAGYNAKGILWRVVYEGEVILERSRVPSLDACRALVPMGITGKLGVYRNDALQFTIRDIGEGAEWTVIDSPTRGLYWERYKAFADADEDMAGIG